MSTTARHCSNCGHKVPEPSELLSLVRRLVEWGDRYPDSQIKFLNDEAEQAHEELQSIETEARRIVEGMK